MNNPPTNSCLESHLSYSFDAVATGVIEPAQEPITYLEQADDIKQLPHSSQRKTDALGLDLLPVKLLNIQWGQISDIDALSDILFQPRKG